MISWKESEKIIKQIRNVECELKNMELKDIYWDRSVKEAVWKKGQINPDYSPHVLRWDKHGRIMMWTKYGRTDSMFGWTIEANDPIVDGSMANLDNLHPVNSFSPKRRKKDLESPPTGG